MSPAKLWGINENKASPSVSLSNPAYTIFINTFSFKVKLVFGEGQNLGFYSKA
jgi:hypothetical protein